MGQTISDMIIAIVTIDTTPVYHIYYRYLDPFVQWIPAPRRVMTVNWSTVGTTIYSAIADFFKAIPPYFTAFLRILKTFCASLLRLSIHPIFFIVPVILLYHVLVAETLPTESVSQRQIKDNKYQHWLMTTTTNYPNQAYAHATAAV